MEKNETNLEKAKRLIKAHAEIQGIELADDNYFYKMLDLAATPDLKCEGKETPEELSNCIKPDVSVSLLERAEMLISDTHEYWHRDYDRWRNER